jgi:hypothetical protein
LEEDNVTKLGLQFEKATPAELLARQQAVALTDTDHLLRWLQKTNRTFLVLYTPDLVKCLSDITDESGEPVGLLAFQQVVNAYRGHRLTLPSGEVQEEEARAPDGTKHIVRTEKMKDDTLTTAELDRAIRQLTREMFDRNPSWSLEDDPL